MSTAAPLSAEDRYQQVCPTHKLRLNVEESTDRLVCPEGHVTHRWLNYDVVKGRWLGLASAFSDRMYLEPDEIERVLAADPMGEQEFVSAKRSSDAARGPRGSRTTTGPMEDSMKEAKKARTYGTNVFEDDGGNRMTLSLVPGTGVFGAKPFRICVKHTDKDGKSRKGYIGEAEVEHDGRKLLETHSRNALAKGWRPRVGGRAPQLTEIPAAVVKAPRR